ncbi:transglycosylase domain-containing protein [Flavobacterium sp. NRK1]|uniref:transglycosylase domain-containing protein n=1 Tax=Flavobacterium sp. NRK1 TaxID=2954929 RepID=UPI002092153E|nr:transglycosylase domain-containing protein [Flavobacterium sp. NRK1]MCO6148414.1 transglycosylase domain-containing protein [Flavobacterium sp. NRK1]
MKKVFKIFVLSILLIVAAFFTYIRFGGYWIESKSDRDKMIDFVKTAHPLPDNFINVYRDLYPEAINNNGWKYIFKSAGFDKALESPSIRTVEYFAISRFHGSFFFIAQLNFVLEDNVTQLQCLNRNLSVMDFTKGVIGIENASKQYFSKPLEELNEDEILEIITRIYNPSLYNKERRPEIFQNKLNALKNRLVKNRSNR